MSSERIISVISMSKRYKQRPSQIIGVTDEYTAYCFDEACLYIWNMMEDGKEPKFKKVDNKLKQRYSRPSDMYKDMGFGNGFVKVDS